MTPRFIYQNYCTSITKITCISLAVNLFYPSGLCPCAECHSAVSAKLPGPQSAQLDTPPSFANRFGRCGLSFDAGHVSLDSAFITRSSTFSVPSSPRNSRSTCLASTTTSSSTSKMSSFVPKGAPSKAGLM